MKRSRNGFTLVEMIVAMSVILILATLTIVGVRSMLQSTKTSATRVMLQSAETILDQWRRAAGPNGRMLTQTYAQAILPNSLDAEDPSSDRTGKAVRLTRAFMFRMSQLPDVRKAIHAQPADRLEAFDKTIDNVNYAADRAQLNDKTVFECWQPPVRKSYICYYQRPFPSTTAYPDPNDNDATTGTIPGIRPNWPNFWLETNAQTPVFTDAWNNPLILFPSCGFMVGNDLHTSTGVFTFPVPDPYWNPTQAYATGDMTIYAANDGVFRLYRCNAPGAGNVPGTSTQWVHIPTRPFFASAGPDGVFYDGTPESLQDNLYSFEQ